MAVALIKGSCGLIGSEAAKYFHGKGLDILGIDNDMRGYFSGKDASSNWQRAELERTLPRYRNIGGSRHSNCSILEAIERIEELCDRPLRFEVSEQARSGDHIWWISDVRKFQRDFPEWSYQYDLNRILREMVEATREKVAGTGA
jgi:CDP-paratose 2-epimerase